ncbi:hypothetical protein [Streptomyces sp. AN091965]|uniref:hypothetical protein n=1 Tax=Streptomyces sp. AN091965 TaxID=2927803 RepID=UPI001F606257|nr:hypothetical protein [Streptomyces sp. AN091965]MCI3929209.1 hypothetical protein [Streptomyces sp. AN091965]
MSLEWTSAPLPAGTVVVHGPLHFDADAPHAIWELIAKSSTSWGTEAAVEDGGRLQHHLRNTLKAQHVLNELDAVERLIADEAQVDRPLPEILLAQVEHDSDLPSITSGLAYGLRQHTCSKIACALREADRRFGDSYHVAGKTFASFAALGQLITVFEAKASHATADRVRVMEALAEAKATVRRAKAASQELLNLDVDRQYEFLSHVPPHGTSPCGVLRLAAPIVPGAPGVHRSPTQESVTIAA